uniref:Uncharacterized protein n=1 Tax=Rhizophora mucronata TaxID=61149 RepID=A0A2P2QH32_RHIMU
MRTPHNTYINKFKNIVIVIVRRRCICFHRG